MNPIRVLHVDDASTWRGGQQQVVYLHEGLSARGFDSVVVCKPRGALESHLVEAGLPRWALAMRGTWDLHSARQLGDAALRWGAIVHAHTAKAHSLALMAHRLSGSFPLVVSRRVDFAVGRGWWSRRKYRSRRVSAYLAISSGVERELLRGGVAPEKIYRVPSGIDLERFDNVPASPDWRSQLRIPSGRFLLGNVAALAPHKDQATLLRAFRLLLDQNVDAHLVILGEGELRASLESLVRELRLREHVTLPGFAEDILTKMKTFDAYVTSSELEGLGTSMLDAMALGLPVVATDTGGIPDAVRHEQTGLLVAPKDPPALASAMERLARDGDERERLGAAAAQTVRHEFDVQRTINLTVEVYRTLLAEDE